MHGRRDVRSNPFVIGNPIVSSMAFFTTNNIPQIPGDDIAKKWNQRQFKGKKRKRKKIYSIVYINYNVKREKKNKNTKAIIVLNKSSLRRCFLCSIELLFSEIKSFKVYLIPKSQAKKNVFQLKQ